MANPTRWPPDRRDLLVRLWEEGHDRPYIARRLGVTPNNVGRRAYMYGARRPRRRSGRVRTATFTVPGIPPSPNRTHGRAWQAMSREVEEWREGGGRDE